MNLFLSQSLERLAEALASRLSSDLFQTTWILVPTGPIKQWLALKLAERPQEKVLMGPKICSVEEMLLGGEAYPSAIERFYLIYRELPPSPHRLYTESDSRYLAKELSSLFASYALHGYEEKPGWVLDLFKKMPQSVQRVAEPSLHRAASIHCFGFDFLPPLIWSFLGTHPSLSVYLFSPSMHFWEDLCSDWEKKKLSSLWKKKKISQPVQAAFQTLLSVGPPLLANWGKLGRETLKALDRFPFDVEELYETKIASSVLQKVQQEILSFEKEPFLPDASIQIHRAGSSKLGEIQLLHRAIVDFAQVHKIAFSDMAVLAPDIEDYAPLIPSIFGEIPYRIFNIDVGSKSSFYQGLTRLIFLAEHGWSREELVALFETQSFYRKRGWEPKTLQQNIRWIEAIFAESNDWQKGFAALLYRAIYFDGSSLAPSPPLGELEALEELFSLLTSLHQALACQEEKTLHAWALQWEEIANTYLTCETEDETATNALHTLQTTLLSLRQIHERIASPFPFTAVSHFLKSSSQGALHANRLHAISFASIDTGSIVPAKALFLIGMDEESFPKKKRGSSLDHLKKGYVPSIGEERRFLFLRTLFAAQEFLWISYRALSPEDGKPIGPSLLVTELAQHLCLAPSEPPRAPSQPLSLPCISSLVCKPQPLPLQPLQIQIRDLTSFARHPWKYYLRKVLGISLEEEISSLALLRTPALRATLRLPLEKAVQFGRLRPGILDEAFHLDIGKRGSEWQKALLGKQVVSVAFLQTAREKRQISKSHWEMGPLEFALPDGPCVRLVGEIEYATTQGAIHLKDDTIAACLQSWPEHLALCLAFGISDVLFLKSGKTKTIGNPLKAMESFLSYYLTMSSSCSPLLPDWADAFLRGKVSDFEKKVVYEDPVFEWLLPRLEIPPDEALFHQWAWLKSSFSELIALYPSRGEE